MSLLETMTPLVDANAMFQSHNDICVVRFVDESFNPDLDVASSVAEE